jgi:hypothetical protein
MRVDTIFIEQKIAFVRLAKRAFYGLFRFHPSFLGGKVMSILNGAFCHFSSSKWVFR